MKNFAALFISLLFFGSVFAQTIISPPVQIGPQPPPTLAILNISSTQKGILIPRMPEAQRDMINSPVQGLLIYQTNNDSGFYFYKGTTWQPVTPESWLLTGNKGTDPAINFIGTTDSAPLKFMVYGQPSGLINPEDSNTTFGFRAGVGLVSLSKRNTFFRSWCR